MSIDREPVLWWIIGSLGTVLAAVFGIIWIMLQSWQRRVERRLQAYHHHSNVLQWLVMTVSSLYRAVFKRDPPPPPDREDEEV